MTPEELQQRIARDKRLQAIDDRFVIERELRESRAVQLVLTDLKDDALRASLELAETNPADTAAITKLVARAQGYAYIRSRLDYYLQLGQAAEAIVRDEDTTRLDERYDGASDL